MALDERDLSALRRLRARSSPTTADRTRIESRLASVLIPATLSVSAPSSPPPVSTLPAIPTTVCPAQGEGVLGSPNLVPTGIVSGGANAGGLIGTMGMKVVGVVLSTIIAIAVAVSASYFGSSSRATEVSNVQSKISAVGSPATDTLHKPSTDAEIAAPISSSATETEPPRTATARSAVRTVAGATQPATKRDVLQSEIEVLRTAQEALRDGDPLAALRQLEKKETSFLLARDREGLRAVALCEANQEAVGQKAAQRFLRRHSSSALAYRVRSACAKFLAPATSTEVSR